MEPITVEMIEALNLGPEPKDFSLHYASRIVPRTTPLPPPKAKTEDNVSQLFGYAANLDYVCIAGIVLNDKYYSCSAPHIPSRQPMSSSVLSLILDSYFGAGTTVAFLDLKGKRIATVQLEDENGHVVYVEYDGVSFRSTSKKYLCYGIRTPHTDVTFDGPAEPKTPYAWESAPLQTVPAGYLIQHNLSTYVVEFDHTFRLLARDTGYYHADHTLAIAAPVEKKHCGLVCEVAPDGTFLAVSESTKVNSRSECDLIRRMPRAGDIKSLLSSAYGTYSMLYHIGYYLRELFMRDMTNFDVTPEIVAKVFPFQTVYSAAEIATVVRQYRSVAGTRQWVFVTQASDNPYLLGDHIFTIFLPPLKDLTVDVFLELEPWRKNKSFGATIRTLVGLGFSFTNLDLELLYKKFLRKFDDCWYYVPNKAYFPYIRPFETGRLLLAPPYLPQLPYARALVARKFFKQDLCVHFIHATVVVDPPVCRVREKTLYDPRLMLILLTAFETNDVYTITQLALFSRSPIVEVRRIVTTSRKFKCHDEYVYLNNNNDDDSE